MKFFAVFIACLAAVFAFAMFGGMMFFARYGYFWPTMVVVALVLAALVSALLGLSDRMDALEKRIRELEEQHNTQEDHKP